MYVLAVVLARHILFQNLKLQNVKKLAVYLRTLFLRPVKVFFLVGRFFLHSLKGDIFLVGIFHLISSNYLWMTLFASVHL